MGTGLVFGVPALSGVVANGLILIAVLRGTRIRTKPFLFMLRPVLAFPALGSAGVGPGFSMLVCDLVASPFLGLVNMIISDRVITVGDGDPSWAWSLERGLRWTRCFGGASATWTSTWSPPPSPSSPSTSPASASSGPPLLVCGREGRRDGALRYAVICHPFRFRHLWTRYTCLVVIAATWLFALAANVLEIFATVPLLLAKGLRHSANGSWNSRPTRSSHMGESPASRSKSLWPRYWQDLSSRSIRPWESGIGAGVSWAASCCSSCSP